MTGPTIRPAPYPDFDDGALCRQTAPDIFFPDKGGSTKEAKATCRVCDWQRDCAAYALTHDERFGIWGGMSERDRRRIRKEFGIVPAAVPVSFTTALTATTDDYDQESA